MNPARASVIDMCGFVAAGDGGDIVRDVSLSVAAGEILGVVGESGAGKSTLALGLLGFARAGVSIRGGTLRIAGRDVDLRDERACRAIRGRLISYVPQNPGAALNPSMRVRDVIAEMHSGRDDSVRATLRKVGLPADAGFAARFPHQLSGGQQQRVCIGVALTGGPPVVVLDEPTTGLDVITQAQIIEELARLRAEDGVAAVYITHDLAVVSSIADRVAVLYAGRIVEQGPVGEILTNPRHPYTVGLVRSTPDHRRGGMPRAMAGSAPRTGSVVRGCAFAPRCPLAEDACLRDDPAPVPVGPRHEARCLRTTDTDGALTREPVQTRTSRPAPTGAPVLSVTGLAARHGSGRDAAVVARDIDFDIRAGECVALVGQSGSGKTTIARAVAGLHTPSAGEIRLDGAALGASVGRRSREQLRAVQMIFQQPEAALNPRRAVLGAVMRPAIVLRRLDRGAARAEATRLMDAVRLPAGTAGRYPAELSGGERQRVAIACALAARPRVLVCDEITSALDVSVQAAVLATLAEIRDEMNLALLFITHDLGVVAAIADTVLVLDRGGICERGPVAQVLSDPREDYTRELIAAAPVVDTGREVASA